MLFVTVLMVLVSIFLIILLCHLCETVYMQPCGNEFIHAIFFTVH